MPGFLTVGHVKAARALLGWSQGDLALAAGLPEPAVARLEAADGSLGGRPGAGKLRRALEAAGIEFLNGGAPGVQLRPKGEGYLRPDQLDASNDV